MDEIHQKIVVNPCLEAYQSFFDVKWQENFLDLIRESKIYESGFTLTRHWWAISNARQLPWIFFISIDQLMCNKIVNYEPHVCKTVNYLRDNIISLLESDNEKVRPMLRKKIQHAIETVYDKVNLIRDQTAEEVINRREYLWDGLMKLSPFHISLWSLERLCYAGLYYSYEWFLTECVRTKNNDPDYRWNRKEDFTKIFRTSFGEILTEKCWLDNKVDLARVARHALVHNGGKITDELRKRNHTFVIEGEEIQINAMHTTELYNELKSRVTELAESAVKMPEFKESGGSKT
jgi:hypothetical protein